MSGADGVVAGGVAAGAAVSGAVLLPGEGVGEVVSGAAPPAVDGAAAAAGRVAAAGAAELAVAGTCVASLVKNGEKGVTSKGIFSAGELRVTGLALMSSRRLVQGSTLTRPPNGNAAT